MADLYGYRNFSTIHIPAQLFDHQIRTVDWKLLKGAFRNANLN